MIKKQIYLLLVLLCWTLNSQAQQTPLMSHYMFNGQLLNPAYAGSKEYVSATMLYRKQWSGIEGAPVTYSGAIHGLIKKRNLGLGLIMQQDKIGVTGQTDMYAQVAYHLPLGDDKLSVGIQAGLSNFSSETVKLNYWDPGDQVFDYNTFTSLVPNAGLGVYYYRNLFYAGVSSPFLLSYDPNETASLDPSTPTHKMDRRFYFTTGGVIETEKDIKIKPSLLVKSEGKTPLQYDLNLNFLINDIFWIGGSYRSESALVILLEYQITRKLRVGYSYDYSIGRLSNYLPGSHEFMLGYDFGFPVIKMKSPRYF